MFNKEYENNYCSVLGSVESEPTLSHEIYEEKFFTFRLKTGRLSESFDYIVVTVSEKLIDDSLDLSFGARVRINGQFRSYNNYAPTGNRLILTLFAKDIENADMLSNDSNDIVLDGYICKSPVYRITPFGREITDILLAVNRFHNKSDYIPCIAWGRNAKYASTLLVGERIKIYGRIQSRDYIKRLEDESEITKTAYEVSISKIELIKNED